MSAESPSRSEDPRRDLLVRELDALLRTVWPEHPAGALPAQTELRRVGITSSQHISFLSRVETAFGFDWEDVDPADGALSSIDGLAAILLTHVPGAATRLSGQQETPEGARQPWTET
jgi:hypothetical protein